MIHELHVLLQAKTKDIGGHATTDEFTYAVINYLHTQ